jgi:hypothetical protein
MRWVVMGLAAGLLAGALAPAHGQKKKQPQRARRETNASRQARIQRTIDETYGHKYEVFGGGGFLRFRSGEYAKKDNQVSWAASGSRYFSPSLAVVAAAQGSFGYAHPSPLNNTFGVYKPQINEYMFMGGANYRFYRKEKIALSVQGTGGLGWGIFSGGAKGLTGPDVGIWQDGFRPAFSVALNADYNIYPNLAVRLSPTYMGTTFQSGKNASGVTAPSPTVQNNIGFNVGIIYRFGKQ